MMDFIIEWRKFEIKTLSGEKIDHIVWQFREGSNYFSCSCLSINKRRRPKRIFIKLAVHRPRKAGKEFNKDGEFLVEDKQLWKKFE